MHTLSNTTYIEQAEMRFIVEGPALAVRRTMSPTDDAIQLMRFFKHFREGYDLGFTAA